MNENGPHPSQEEENEDPSISRRKFIRNAVLGTVGAGLTVLGVKYAAEHKEQDSIHHGQGLVKEKRHLLKGMIGVSPNVMTSPESYAIIITVDNTECYMNVKKEDYDKYSEGEKVEVSYIVDGTGVTNSKATELKKIDGSDKITDPQ